MSWKYLFHSLVFCFLMQSSLSLAQNLESPSSESSYDDEFLSAVKEGSLSKLKGLQVFPSEETLLSALTISSKSGFRKITEYLLDTFIFSTDELDNACLLASQEGHTKIVKLLVQHGAKDIQAGESKGIQKHAYFPWKPILLGATVIVFSYFLAKFLKNPSPIAIDDNCLICLEALDTDYCQLHCGHYFHKACFRGVFLHSWHDNFRDGVKKFLESPDSKRLEASIKANTNTDTEYFTRFAQGISKSLASDLTNGDILQTELLKHEIYSKFASRFRCPLCRAKLVEENPT